MVGEEHLIDFARDGMPEILRTPWLVWFLEHAARNAVLPALEPGESAVGVGVGPFNVWTGLPPIIIVTS